MALHMRLMHKFSMKHLFGNPGGLNAISVFASYVVIALSVLFLWAKNHRQPYPPRDNERRQMEAHAGKGGDNMKRVGGVAGKYAKLRDDGANAVLLAPEVAAAFPDSKSVNDALRTLIKIAEPRKTER